MLLATFSFSASSMACSSSSDKFLKIASTSFLPKLRGTPSIDETTRAERLAHWEGAPGARYCHPREEHLLPLHVCYGVTRGPCIGHADLTIMGKKASTFFW